MLFGKILRIDVNNADSGKQYVIPPTNPFVNQSGAQKEIWTLGLRNPWRITFDRATGDLYIGDVGQSAWEEIDFQPAGSAGGQNYGWNPTEGAHCFPPGNFCNPALYSLPIAEYPHSSSTAR